MGDIQYSIHTSSLLKAGLMKCLNYQHAQIVFGMLGIVTALFLTVLYFSFCIYTFGYQPIYPINYKV